MKSFDSESVRRAVIEIMIIASAVAIFCCLYLLNSVVLANSEAGGAGMPPDRLAEAVLHLKDQCIDSFHQPDWWSYVWCYQKDVKQVHLNDNRQVEVENYLGSYQAGESSILRHIYRGSVDDCAKEDGSFSVRSVEVNIGCCSKETLQLLKSSGNPNLHTFIERYQEPETCRYELKVCSELVCVAETESAFDRDRRLNHVAFRSTPITEERPPVKPSTRRAVTSHDQRMLLDRVRDAFVHSYDAYMRNASPAGELKPISCVGGNFELVKLPLVTLIDTLDTLALMGNFSEFRRAVRVVSVELPQFFNFDVNVSVFETTIRVLGGLLSAHLMAVDPSLGIYKNVSLSYVVPPKPQDTLDGLFSQQTDLSSIDDTADASVLFAWNQQKHECHHENIEDFCGVEEKRRSELEDSLVAVSKPFRDEWFYDNNLLSLAVDLAERLLPAFDTETDIPFGTVNLRYGVPEGETDVASTAGAGSLMLEFEALTRLTGDSRFGEAARRASAALFERKSTIGLLGKHIHANSGKWVEVSSGIGSNSDSYYEYLLKHYLLFQDDDAYAMFAESFHAVKKYVQNGDWFSDVDMFSGKARRNRVESLHGFWAGMESSIGYPASGTRLLNALFAVWLDLGFLPEEFDQTLWLTGKGPIGNPYYPLRPELIESTYHHYRASGDRSWLHAAELFLESLESKARTSCGFASILNVQTAEKEDNMPSFFLSETLKYLYLLFDEDNFVHHRPYIFTTEAHLFDPVQLISRRFTATNASNGARKVDRSEGGDSGDVEEAEDEEEEEKVNENSGDRRMLAKRLPDQCTKWLYWDGSLGFNPEYLSSQGLGMGIQPLTRAINAKAYEQTVNEAAIAHQAVSKLSRLVDRIASLKNDHRNRKLEAAALVRDSLVNAALAAQGQEKLSMSSLVDNVCFPGDEPPPTPLKTLGSSGDGPQQIVQFSAPKLGEFEVSIFADGFIVTSLQTKDTIEIGNVGHDAVLVRSKVEHSWASSSSESPSSVVSVKTRATVGAVNGKSRSCTVSLVNASGHQIDFPEYEWPRTASSDEGSPTSNEQTKPAQMERWKGPWEQGCSLPMYGPTDGRTIVGRLRLADKTDVQMCQKSKTAVAASAQGSWWPIHWTQAKPAKSAKSRKESKGRFVVPELLLAKRGGCLFQEKTESAQELGYDGLIIANNEEGLFLMAGKMPQATPVPTNTMMNKIHDLFVPPSKTTAEEESITIPSAMITNGHAHQLNELASAHYKATGEESFVKLDIPSDFVSLSSELFGAERHFPMVRMMKNQIHAIGEQNWGVVLSSTTGQEWQLYIMNQSDLLNPMGWPIEVFNRQNEALCTTEALSLNAVELYWHWLGSTCPSFVNFDGKVWKLV